MQADNLFRAHEPESGSKSSSKTVLRDVVTVAFRHRRLGLTVFFAVLAGAALVIAFTPRSYQSSLKILVRNERADPLVSSASEANQQLMPAITPEELHSEVELLKSEDVLRKVALKTGLVPPPSALPWGPRTQEERVAEAVRALRNGIDAGQVPRTNIIEVKYALPNPQLVAGVLNTLGDFYLEKHLNVYRTSGQFDFFDKEAARYAQALQDAEAKLTNSVEPQLMRDLTVEKLNDFKATLQQTRAAIAETERRIHTLEQQQADTPARLTTQERRSDNPVLLQTLKTTLLTLELKRIELLTKYQPTYRPVQELDKQIADTKAAIAKEENAPVREQTTDQNPVHLWERSELAKATADLAGLQARAAAIEQTIGAYDQRAEVLNQKTIQQQDLLRAKKAAEDNYLLYLRKREEARITDALDQKRILNVAIAEKAHVPVLPATPASTRLALAAVLALIVSIGTVAGSEYLDPTFRTPAEVADTLAIPVLAAIPTDRPKRRDFGGAAIQPQEDDWRNPQSPLDLGYPMAHGD
jgi:uncharacterized protein involved in exopolysaccharide biosynthesis